MNKEEVRHLKLFLKRTNNKVERIKETKMMASAFDKLKRNVPKKKAASKNQRGKRGKYGTRVVKKPSKL